MEGATIDRSNEGAHDDASITVILPCGFKVDFWLMGQSDKYYLSAANRIKEEESNHESMCF